jgi:hypothetical protein
MAEYRLTQRGPDGFVIVEADSEHEARIYMASALLLPYAASAGAKLTGLFVVEEEKEEEPEGASD